MAVISAISQQPATQRQPIDVTSRPESLASGRMLTDDEILGIADPRKNRVRDGQLALDSDEAPVNEETTSSQSDAREVPPELTAVFDANPEFRRAWDDARSYREAFATPEEARATGLLADLDRMDELFFSQRPEDHAELARAVASLDPNAFASLAKAIAAQSSAGAHAVPVYPEHRRGEHAWQSANDSASVPDAVSASRGQMQTRPNNQAASPEGDNASGDTRAQHAVPLQVQTLGAPATNAQTEFFHTANAAAVQGVLDAIETQVDRLLPEGISKSARNRVVGEIYRELDTTLRSNRQLGHQMRDAFRAAEAKAAGPRRLAKSIIAACPIPTS